ncbi:hypothetical protein AGMMS50230_19180 [Spirochaetia bacterium]|nr:hypothetical protein AGMMS50230_19110 [Spirochaetia bacterium]GHV86310.1 hypothetical protein AGMMS50230_19180 [Spirochaetia bacterium]
MKKNIVLIITVLTLALTMGASNTTYPVDISKLTRDIFVVDERLPKEQSVVLVFPYGLKITNYNGAPVDWMAAGNNKAIYFPPGRIRLLMAYGRQNRVFERTFTAGEHYLIKQRIEHAIPMLVLEDLNKKTKMLEQEYYYFPRPAKTVLEPQAKPVQKPPAASTGTATVIFGVGFWVFDYNGADIYDEWYPKGKVTTGERHLWRVNKVAVPAGGTTITFDTYFETPGWQTTFIFVGQNYELSYNFEAGKEYTLALFARTPAPGQREVYLGLWPKANRSGMQGRIDDDSLLKSWKLAET